MQIVTSKNAENMEWDTTIKYVTWNPDTAARQIDNIFPWSHSFRTCGKFSGN